jgi:ketosteroid isomerase-like protein
MTTDDHGLRRRNKELLRYYYTHMFEILAGGIDEVRKYKTEDASSWTPYGGGEPRKGANYGIEGMQTVPVTFKFWRHEIINIVDTVDPNVFWLEADAVSRTRTLDLDYHQRYVCLMTFRDGKLSGNKEYFNGDQVRLLMLERQHQDLLNQTGG